MNVDHWFPRCYDLSMNGQAEELLDDYLKTTCRVIVRKHFKLFQSNVRQTYEQVNSFKLAMKGHINYKDQKSDLVWDLIKSSPENIQKKNKNYISPFLLNRRLVEKALKIVKVCYRNENMKQGELNDLVKDCLKPKDLPQQTQNTLNKMFSEKIWNELIAYS